MLGIWCSHTEYQLSLINNILPFYISNKLTVEYYSDALAKLYTLDLDVLKPLIEPCFSTKNKSVKEPSPDIPVFLLQVNLQTNNLKYFGLLF